MRLNRFLFAHEPGVLHVLVFLAFDIDVRPQRLDDRQRGGVFDDDDVIDAFEGREVLCAQLLRDVRAGAVLFLDAIIAGQRDDQGVPDPRRPLQVAHVAGVDDVEAAVAEHDASAGGTVLGRDLGEAFKPNELAVGGWAHGGSPSGQITTVIPIGYRSGGTLGMNPPPVRLTIAWAIFTAPDDKQPTY